MKIRPIPDRLREFNDGYRGDHTIGWELVYKRSRVFEHFATYCVHCGQSWGWTFDRAKIKTLHRAMRARGCPRCPPKKRERLRRASE